jgi:CSLREA domain-containing protein
MNSVNIKRFSVHHNSLLYFVFFLIICIVMIGSGWTEGYAGIGTQGTPTASVLTGQSPDIGSGRDPALVKQANINPTIIAVPIQKLPNQATPMAASIPQTGANKPTKAVESISEIAFTVDSTVDDVDTNPGDGICATASGKCTLRAAIMESNIGATPDTINLPAGTYILSLPGSGEDASASGDLDINDTLVINGAGEATTIIQGSALDRVIEITGSEGVHPSVTLANLSVRDGTDNGSNSSGGIHIRSAAVTLSNVIVSDNIGEGIGIDASSLVINNSIVSRNSSNGVGGIRSTSSALSVINCTIIENRGAWGGIGTDNGLIMVGTTVSNNTGTNGPGGLHLLGDSKITNSTISNNNGTEGGGIWFDQGNLLITSSTITENSANGSGGESKSGTGGGIFFKGTFGSVNLKNTILSGNNASGGKPDCEGTFTSGGYNLVGSASDCGFTSSSGDLSGISPAIGPLQNNGGRTSTHALLPGSPAIEAGNPAGCQDSDGTPLNTDQRGSPRPADGNGDGNPVCDIGAFELSAPSPTSIPLSPTTTLPTPVAPTSLPITSPTFIPTIPINPTPTLVTPSPATTPTSIPVTPPPPIPPTVIPIPPWIPTPNCSNVIMNGSFENNDGWFFPTTRFTASYDNSLAHTGLRSARTGIVNPVQDTFSYSSAWQQITIPWDATSASLSFWAYPMTSSMFDNPMDNDLQMTIIVDQPFWIANLNSTGDRLFSFHSNARQWSLFQYDLRKYAGRTAYIYFGTFNNGWLGWQNSSTSMFVDDVSLIICRP